VENNAHKKPGFLISKRVDAFFLEVLKIFQFIKRYFKETFSGNLEFFELLRQCYKVGVHSLPLISLTGFVTGFVFTKQSRPSLAEFGATSWIPSLVAIAIIRAMAPLVTALITAGKVGSNMGAELGSMKVTEQIDAMEVSGVNDFKFLVVTRVTASTLMMPVLMCFMGLIAMFGSYVNVVNNEGTSWSLFIANAFDKITFLDIGSSFVKAVSFGFTIGLVSCYQGYTAKNGTEGVGKAANAAVVMSMFLIFIEEILIVQVTNYFR